MALFLDHTTSKACLKKHRVPNGSASGGCRSPEPAPQGWESLESAALAGTAALHQLLGHVTAFCPCIKMGVGLPPQHQSWE